MVTIFEISIWSNGIIIEHFFMLVFGLILLTVLLSKELRERKKKKSLGTMVGVVLPLLLSPLWLGFNSFLLWNYYTYTEAILEKYENGNYSVVEGVVEVLHTEAKAGHDWPDKIRINGREFTFSIFDKSPFFIGTVNRRRDLKNGVHARISYMGNSIVKVEIEKDTTET